MDFVNTHMTEISIAIFVASLMLVINFLRVLSEVSSGMATLPVIFVNAVLPYEYDFDSNMRNRLSEVPTAYHNKVYIPSDGLVDTEYGQLIYSLTDNAIYVRGLFGVKLLQKIQIMPSVQPQAEGQYSMFIFGAWRSVHENCVGYLRKTLYTNNHS